MKLQDLRLRLRAFFFRKRVERELQEELEFHLEMQARKNASRGMHEEDAWLGARVRFGRVSRVVEDCRRMRGLEVVDELGQDVRCALRSLKRNPGFTVVAVLTLALGIGMNATVFSVVNAVLLRPLPYPEPDRLVSVYIHNGGLPFGAEAAGAADFTAWRDRAQSFDAIVAYDNVSDQTLATEDDAVQLRIAWVSDDFWKFSGAIPAFGRFPNDSERNALLLTHNFFARRFHGNSAVIGKAVNLNGRQVTITGVLPKDFLFQLPYGFRGPGFEPREIEAFRPLILQSQQRGRGQILQVVARLKAGVTIDQARVELQAIQAGDRASGSVAVRQPVQVVRCAASGKARP